MEYLFITLTEAVSGAPAMALAAALGWGVLSVLLSPCHLASIPLIVGYINGREGMTTRRAFALSSLFAVGILATVAMLGVATAAAGRMMGDVGSWGNWLVAGIFLLVGLHLLDLLPSLWSAPGRVPLSRKGMGGAFLLGLLFGIALGPCTFAFMAPVLGVAFGMAGGSLLYGSLLLVAYGVGHCFVIVLAGTFTESVQRFLNWNERSRGSILLRKACGALVLVAGGWMVYLTL